MRWYIREKSNWRSEPCFGVNLYLSSLCCCNFAEKALFQSAIQHVYAGLKDSEALWLAARHNIVNITGSFRHGSTFKDDAMVLILLFSIIFIVYSLWFTCYWELVSQSTNKLKLLNTLKIILQVDLQYFYILKLVNNISVIRVILCRLTKRPPAANHG